MDRLTAVFVEGMGAAAATSRILTQLQGQIFGFLYLSPDPVSLDELTDELQQSKSNVSVSVRGLIDWQLVRRLRVPGSRKDHYQAATDFWRVMQEIMERRFRWNLRQVVSATEQTEQAIEESTQPDADAAERADFIARRVTILRDFFVAVDVGLSGFTRGEAFAPQPLQKTVVKVPIEGGSSVSEGRTATRRRR
jgi:DNA-binding transcriptional regulator GbsR (MarR family)